MTDCLGRLITPNSISLMRLTRGDMTGLVDGPVGPLVGLYCVAVEGNEVGNDDGHQFWAGSHDAWPGVAMVPIEGTSIVTREAVVDDTEVWWKGYNPAICDDKKALSEFLVEAVDRAYYEDSGGGRLWYLLSEMSYKTSVIIADTDAFVDFLDEYPDGDWEEAELDGRSNDAAYTPKQIQVGQLLAEFAQYVADGGNNYLDAVLNYAWPLQQTYYLEYGVPEELYEVLAMAEERWGIWLLPVVDAPVKYDLPTPNRNLTGNRCFGELQENQVKVAGYEGQNLATLIAADQVMQHNNHLLQTRNSVRVELAGILDRLVSHWKGVIDATDDTAVNLDNFSTVTDLLTRMGVVDLTSLGTTWRLWGLRNPGIRFREEQVPYPKWDLETKQWVRAERTHTTTHICAGWELREEVEGTSLFSVRISTMSGMGWGMPVEVIDKDAYVYGSLGTDREGGTLALFKGSKEDIVLWLPDEYAGEISGLDDLLEEEGG